ncbi:cupin-like domain-containing protein [Engelhardtia mirabilis]|uniref:JmjC domain-containing protein n=1 Tax=Engelhardtia mirabilis TaxID=2528011 RepID=A0A518BGP0_9BACT|nr:hypothetical protein Pla133_12180 [Planctomycetes bacterium Pla133]QDV00479.1 hypothetical protein Pla86_12180 [Planctomycetes bacterium Pla86]
MDEPPPFGLPRSSVVGVDRHGAEGDGQSNACDLNSSESRSHGPASAAATPLQAAGPDWSLRARAQRFRAASRAVEVPLVDRLRFWLYYIGLAHGGTPVYSPTRDACYAEGFLRRGYDKQLERINRRLASEPWRFGPIPVPVFRADEVSPIDQDFLTRLRIPYVLRGAARGLPLMDWSLDYLERGWGHCTGPINAALDRPDPIQTRPTKAHHYYDFRLGTLGEVAESIRRGGPARFVVAEDVMHADGGSLLRDLDLAHWERISGWERNRGHWLRSRLAVGKVFSAQLLVQPERAYSLWHTEGGDNFFVLARGRKRWTLTDPIYSPAMRPRVKRSTNYTGSNIDVRESDEIQRRRGFGGYLGIPRVQADLRPGDMLRVPAFWWHTVETLPGDYTLAASLRIEPGPSLVAPGLLAMRLMDPQAHAMMRAYRRFGRISDALIGQPRRSRSQAVDGTARGTD